jgi:hypothetical protein
MRVHIASNQLGCLVESFLSQRPPFKRFLYPKGTHDSRPDRSAKGYARALHPIAIQTNRNRYTG